LTEEKGKLSRSRLPTAGEKKKICFGAKGKKHETHIENPRKMLWRKTTA
jgi:hypothetical protein